MNILDLISFIEGDNYLCDVMSLFDMENHLKQFHSRYHMLKTINPYFLEVRNCIKKFEIRKDDRNFKVGDYLILVLFDKNLMREDQYILTKITYKFYGGEYGLDKGYCILGLGKIY